MVSPSLISLMFYVDIKHHVYLLTYHKNHTHSKGGCYYTKFPMTISFKRLDRSKHFKIVDQLSS